MSALPLPVFVINLASAVERRERMERLLSQEGIAYTIFKATDGSALGEADHEFWQNSRVRKRLNSGEVGCFLSHLALWEHIIAEGLPGAIVLEDDLCLSAEFAQAVQSLNSADLINQLGLLRLERDRQTVILAKAKLTLDDQFCARRLRRSNPLRAGAYAISRQVAQALCDARARLREPVDAELFDSRRSAIAALECFQLLPPVAQQAEIVPKMSISEPFLASMIDRAGPRADQRTGRSRMVQSPPLVRLMRTVLRPAKSIGQKMLLGPMGWQRQVIDWPDD